VPAVTKNVAATDRSTFFIFIFLVFICPSLNSGLYKKISVGQLPLLVVEGVEAL
jgi:hypothetical protein